MKSSRTDLGISTDRVTRIMRPSAFGMRTSLPLFLRWCDRTNPLPNRVIEAPAVEQTQAVFVGQPWAPSGDANQPFDFCANIERLLHDIVLRSPSFRHIQVPRILISVTQARSDDRHGLQARVTPLRFPHGELTRKRYGVTYHVQRYFLNDHEFLYVLTFCLPRFLDQSFDQKCITLFHELYHFHPKFNGDLRRFDGRYHFHSRRQREYDKEMVQYAREYMASNPDKSLSDFLRLDFAQLRARHGAVTGVIVPKPKIIPLLR
jgi:predicted metallopeptidase